MRAKNENIQNNQGISLSNLHRNLEGKFPMFFGRFLSFVIRPLREADFTPSIFTAKCKSITLMQTSARPEHYKATSIPWGALGLPWDAPW